MHLILKLQISLEKRALRLGSASSLVDQLLEGGRRLVALPGRFRRACRNRHARRLGRPLLFAPLAAVGPLLSLAQVATLDEQPS